MTIFKKGVKMVSAIFHRVSEILFSDQNHPRLLNVNSLRSLTIAFICGRMIDVQLIILSCRCDLTIFVGVIGLQHIHACSA
jgi:hypothetical protein